MDFFVLDAYAARSCPVKTHLNFDPTVVKPRQPDDESLREAFLGGTDFRAVVLEDLVAGSQEVVDLRRLPHPGASYQERLEVSLTTLRSGAPAVVGAVLPLDLAGHRSGQPDALVRGPNTRDGSPGYWPVRIKPYRVREKQPGANTLRYSTLEAIGTLRTLPGMRYRVFREGALLELAHFWRLLEASQLASPQPLGAVIGDESATRPTATWVDLTTKFIRTYSRTAGHKLRSPLERYDHEHRFRVHVAQQAQLRQGNCASAPAVRPIRVKECEWCPWWQVCREEIDEDDLSLRISKAPLDVRELQTLMGLGITTVAQLAKADVEAILPSYLPLTGHRDRAEQRLRQAALRARMLANGVALERVSSEPVGVPRCAVEIDLDIETAEDGSVYLWGVLITDAQGSRFKHFSRFEQLTPASEVELAEEFAAWLVDFITAHPDALVYHYSDYEPVHLERLAARSAAAQLTQAVRLIRSHFVDLFSYVRDNFIGVDGLGLKVVANRAVGFTWRDEQAGGLASQSWFNEAVAGSSAQQRAAARRRVLEYNEDDVRATFAVRDWLSAQDES